MRKISDFLSKPLISVNNATFEGTIVGFLCGKKLKSIEYLCVLVENNTLDEVKYVSIRRVKNVTDDAVVINNNLCIKKADTLDILKFIENPINSNVFTADGILKGKLVDIFFNDLDKYVTKILIDDTNYPISRIASTSKDVIVLYNDGQPPVRKSAPRKVKKPQTDLPVSLLDKTKDIQLSFDDALNNGDDTLYNSLDTLNNSDDTLNNSGDTFAQNALNDTNDNAISNTLNEDDDTFLFETLGENNGFAVLDNSDILENNSNQQSDDSDIATACDILASSKNTTLPKDDSVLNCDDQRLPESKAKVTCDENNIAFNDYNNANSVENCESNADNTSHTPLEISELPLPTALKGANCQPINDKMPAKLISDYRFLLGRVVTNNIYNVHKVLIIKANTIITAEVVEIARKNNKLIELTLSSKS